MSKSNRFKRGSMRRKIQHQQREDARAESTARADKRRAASGDWSAAEAQARKQLDAQRRAMGLIN